MTQVYDVIDAIKSHLDADISVNHVSFGDFSNVDTDKTTLFPLSHFWIQGAGFEGNILTFTLDMMFLDIVDDRNENDDTFYGNDNLQDILNTQFAVVNGLIKALEEQRGALARQQYIVLNEPRAELLYEEFENKLAGWGLSVDIQVPNNYSVC